MRTESVSDQQTPPPGGPRDEQGAPGAGDGPESVGSVGEEAAKLFAALSDVARQRGGDLGGAAASTAQHVSEAVKDAEAHLGHGEDCRYCPLCQAIRLVRETSPEVKAHLAVAASSLMQAAAGLLATNVPDQGSRSGPVERIDLDGDDPEQGSAPEDWGDEPAGPPGYRGPDPDAEDDTGPKTGRTGDQPGPGPEAGP